MLAPFIVRGIIQPVRRRVVSWERDVHSIVRDLERSERFSRDELISLQEMKLRRLLRSAREGSGYYRRIFAEHSIHPDNAGLADLRKIPILDRQAIRTNFQEIVNRSVDSGELVKNLTGGSSGEPLAFFSTVHSKRFSQALLRRGFAWAGFTVGSERVKLWGAPGDIIKATASLKQRLKNHIFNLRLVDAFNCSDELFNDLYRTFRKRPPALLESYADILYEFARFIHNRGLDFLAIPTVVSSAGILHEHMRAMIRGRLSTRVFDRYGSREFGNIAQECACHEGMHVNMERFIVEVDDAAGTNAGGLLVTDLENNGFPFVRYRIGDLGVLTNERCSCGRRSSRILNIAGRDVDVIRTADGKVISGNIFPHIFRLFPQIIKGQVIQDRIDHLHIRLKLVSEGAGADIGDLCKKIREACGDSMTVDVSLDENFIVTPTGKHRPVISNCRKEIVEHPDR